jgi:hypothetical protein
MDPSDRFRPLPDGATCTACGASVPAGRIRILARRDDLAFVELGCARCGNAALGLLLAAAVPGGVPFLDAAGDDPGAWSADDGGCPSTISSADVEAIRGDLAGWDGDLVGWLDRLEGRDRRGSVVDR